MVLVRNLRGPGLNNYFTIFNRENPDGFKFVEHDSEHSLDTGNAGRSELQHGDAAR